MRCQILLWVDEFLPLLDSAMEVLRAALPPAEDEQEEPPGVPPIRFQIVVHSLRALLPLSSRSTRVLSLQITNAVLLSSFGSVFDDPLVGDALDADMPLITVGAAPPAPPWAVHSKAHPPDARPPGASMDLLSQRRRMSLRLGNIEARLVDEKSDPTSHGSNWLISPFRAGLRLLQTQTQHLTSELEAVLHLPRICVSLTSRDCGWVIALLEDAAAIFGPEAERPPPDEEAFIGRLILKVKVKWDGGLQARLFDDSESTLLPVLEVLALLDAGGTIDMSAVRGSNARASVSLSASHFNPKVAAWEPLLEPWEVEAVWAAPCGRMARAVQSAAESASPATEGLEMFLSVTARQSLELIVSYALLHSIAELAESALVAYQLLDMLPTTDSDTCRLGQPALCHSAHLTIPCAVNSDSSHSSALHAIFLCRAGSNWKTAPADPSPSVT